MLMEKIKEPWYRSPKKIAAIGAAVGTLSAILYFGDGIRETIVTEQEITYPPTARPLGVVGNYGAEDQTVVGFAVPFEDRKDILQIDCGGGAKEVEYMVSSQEFLVTCTQGRFKEGFDLIQTGQ